MISKISIFRSTTNFTHIFKSEMALHNMQSLRKSLLLAFWEFFLDMNSIVVFLQKMGKFHL